MKRLKGSPTGLSPSEKERRDQSPTMDELEGTDGGIQIVQFENEGAASVTASVSKRTAKSIMSSGSRTARRELEAECSYRRAKQQSGPWRDVSTVNIWSADGVNFKGVIRPHEAKNKIFLGALNQKKENLHGIKLEFRGHPVVTFRLKTQINVDLEFQDDKFIFNREGPDGPMVLMG